MSETQSYKKVTDTREYTLVNGLLAVGCAFLLGAPFALWMLEVV